MNSLWLQYIKNNKLLIIKNVSYKTIKYCKS